MRSLFSDVLCHATAIVVSETGILSIPVVFITKIITPRQTRFVLDRVDTTLLKGAFGVGHRDAKHMCPHQTSYAFRLLERNEHQCATRRL